MSEAGLVTMLFWWLPYALLLLAGGCFVAGLSNAYRAVWLWGHRRRPISDLVIAKALGALKPPPYAMYAAVWCLVGVGAAASAIVLYG